MFQLHSSRKCAQFRICALYPQLQLVAASPIPSFGGLLLPVAVPRVLHVHALRPLFAAFPPLTAALLDTLRHSVPVL